MFPGAFAAGAGEQLGESGGFQAVLGLFQRLYGRVVRAAVFNKPVRKLQFQNRLH